MLCLSYKKDEKGATILEFSIVALLFFSTIFGFIEIVRLVAIYSSLNYATNEAVLRASLITDFEDPENNFAVSNSVKNSITEAAMHGLRAAPFNIGSADDFDISLKFPTLKPGQTLNQALSEAPMGVTVSTKYVPIFPYYPN